MRGPELPAPTIPKAEGPLVGGPSRWWCCSTRQQAVHGWIVSIASVYHGGSVTPILVFGAGLCRAAALSAAQRRNHAAAIGRSSRRRGLVQDLGVDGCQRRSDDTAGKAIDAALDVGQPHVPGGAAGDFASTRQQRRAKAVRVLFTVFDDQDSSPCPVGAMIPGMPSTMRGRWPDDSISIIMSKQTLARSS